MTDSPFIILDPRRVLPALKPHQWLGRIVRDYKDPSSSFAPSDPTALASHSSEELVISDFAAQVQSSRDASLAASLGSVASGLSGGGNSSTFSFATSSLRCLRLSKHTKFFSEMRQLDEVRSELSEYLRPGGKPAYMIVGVMIWSDPSFMETAQFSNSKSLAAQIPVGAIASMATTGIPITTDIVDPGVNRTVEGATGRQMEGSMAGSYIFAIEYKAVRRKLYSLIKDFTPTLDDHGPRAKGDRVFGTDTPEETASSATNPSRFTIDVDEDVVWTDTLSAGEELHEVELSEVSFAF
ncbi:hypothetical protein CC79DRAFT_1328544 [Sarocladium strictum]